MKNVEMLNNISRGSRKYAKGGSLCLNYDTNILSRKRKNILSKKKKKKKEY